MRRHHSGYKQLRAAMDLWSEGHPLIHFVNVTAQVPAMPSTCKGDPMGAEIDFFAGALTGEQFHLRTPDRASATSHQRDPAVKLHGVRASWIIRT